MARSSLRWSVVLRSSSTLCHWKSFSPRIQILIGDVPLNHDWHHSLSDKSLSIFIRIFFSHRWKCDNFDVEEPKTLKVHCFIFVTKLCTRHVVWTVWIVFKTHLVAWFMTSKWRPECSNRLAKNNWKQSNAKSVKTFLSNYQCALRNQILHLDQQTFYFYLSIVTPFYASKNIFFRLSQRPCFSKTDINFHLPHKVKIVRSASKFSPHRIFPSSGPWFQSRLELRCRSRKWLTTLTPPKKKPAYSCCNTLYVPHHSE